MNTEELEQKLRFFTENEGGLPEVALFFYAGEELPWVLEVGNPSACVRLGEAPGEMTFGGNSLEEVIEQADVHYHAKVAEAEGRVPRPQACIDFWAAGWARKWHAQLQVGERHNRDYPRLAYIHNRLLQAERP